MDICLIKDQVPRRIIQYFRIIQPKILIKCLGFQIIFRNDQSKRKLPEKPIGKMSFLGVQMRVLAKELRVSAIVGAVLGIVNGLRIYLMYTFLFPGQYANVMGYAIVVSVSLFFSVILAKLVGGMLPLAAKKLGADPAIMATPFITTIVDACSLILYFQIAQLVFRNMM